MRHQLFRDAHIRLYWAPITTRKHNSVASKLNARFCSGKPAPRRSAATVYKADILFARDKLPQISSKYARLRVAVVLVPGWPAVTPSYLLFGRWAGSDGPRVADLVQVRRNVPYQSAASVQVSRSYEVRSSNRSRRIRRTIELPELSIRANSITEFVCRYHLSAFLREFWPCPFLHLTGGSHDSS